MLAIQMCISSVVKSKFTIYSNQLVNWGIFKIEDHLPSRFDMNILTFFRYFSTWPISRNIPIPDSIFSRYFSNLFIASTNTSMTLLENSLLFIWVSRLILSIYNHMGLTNLSFIIDYMLTKDPIIWISINGIIFH